MVLLVFVSGICSFQDECGLILIFLWFPKHRYIDIPEHMSGYHVLAICSNFVLLYIVNNTAGIFEERSFYEFALKLNVAGCPVKEVFFVSIGVTIAV